jgi:hypothetical protein
MKQNILKILKEETNLQSKVLNLINTRGLIKTCQTVGGIETVSDILKETPETLLTKYLNQETFSTDDIEKNTGGYNFKFKLLSVKKSERYSDEHNFDFLIEEGTVNLMHDYDDSLWDLLGDDIREFDMWWEIKYEIRDVLSDFVEELIDKIKFDDVKSASVNFIFKGRDQFNYINEEKEKTNINQKLKNNVEKVIKNFTKNVEFPENFLEFGVDIRDNKTYNEKNLILTTIMKKPFNEEETDKLYEIRSKLIPILKNIFKLYFDNFYTNSTSTIDIYNREKEKKEKHGLF